jgi:FkbM family methyltransferase
MFSQRDEETYILEHFKGSTGTFLDLGAYDGVMFSNTRQLALNGWCGVCVEPSPTVLPKLLELYKDSDKIKVLPYAVGDTTEQKTFYDSNGDAVSSLDTKHVKVWKKGSNVKFSPVQVECLTVSDLLDKIGFDFDFINIDTEGISFYILKQLPFDKLINLKMICIEYDGKANDIANFAAQYGFSVLHRTSENLLLVKAENE